MTYMMAGDPDYETSLSIMKGAAEGRRRIDRRSACPSPIRWPMVRRSRPPALRALKAGQTLSAPRSTWRPNFRKDDDETPIIMMGYFNPIYIYGVDRFLEAARAAGIDGLIVVDLPPETDSELCVPALKAGLNFIRLATADHGRTSACRVCSKTRRASSITVSMTGITGSALTDTDAGG